MPLSVAHLIHLNHLSLVAQRENNNNDDRNFSWKSADIDLFYPNMLKNWGDSDVVDKDNKITIETSTLLSIE
jgi:hypothetical protein